MADTQTDRLATIAALCPIALQLAPRPCIAGPPESRVQQVDALLRWLDARPADTREAWLAILESIAKAEPGLQVPQFLERAEAFEALARGAKIPVFTMHPEILRGTADRLQMERDAKALFLDVMNRPNPPSETDAWALVRRKFPEFMPQPPSAA